MNFSAEIIIYPLDIIVIGMVQILLLFVVSRGFYLLGLVKGIRAARIRMNGGEWTV